MLEVLPLGEESTPVESQGIPELLQLIASEKDTDPITVKFPPSLAKFIKDQGGSKYVRQAVIAYLKVRLQFENDLLSLSPEKQSLPDKK